MHVYRWQEVTLGHGLVNLEEPHVIKHQFGALHTAGHGRATVLDAQLDSLLQEPGNTYSTMTDSILQLGHPDLRRVAKSLDSTQPQMLLEVSKPLVQALQDFRDQHGFGRAVAAPQLGYSVRMIALALPGWPSIVINPEIIWRSEEQVTLWDDCMCFPSLLVRVQRQASISLRFQDLDGVDYQRENLAVDLSELFQHEIDHLDGVLSMDRAVGEDPVISRHTFNLHPESFLEQVSYRGAMAKNLIIERNYSQESLPQVTSRFIDPYSYPAGVAYMEHQYLPMSEAKISVLDFGFLRSDATYDVVHVHEGRFFRLDRHLQRFFASMEKLQLDAGKTHDQIKNILIHCVAISGLREAYVEMICTRGASPDFSRDPRQAKNRFLAFAVPYTSVASPAQLKGGLHLAIGSTQRISARSVDPQVKNYHWLDMVRGMFEAYEKQADNVLLLDDNGYLTEGPGFNIFMIKDAALKTPDSGVLHGITRETVFNLCTELDWPVSATKITVEDLLASDEIFITSTAGGIMPVTTINAQPIGDAEVGTLTRELMSIYWRKHQDPEWTTAVDYSNT